MKLGMQVGLGPGHIVLDGDPAPPPPKGAQPPIFGPYLLRRYPCCGQMAAWVKMSLGMELGLGRDDFVLDGDPAPPPQRGGGQTPQIKFGPCLLWPNGWLGEAGTWHEGGLSSGDFVLDEDPAPSPKRGRSPLLNFRPISIVAKRLDA